MDLSPLQITGGGMALTLGAGSITAFFNWLGQRSNENRLAHSAVEGAARDLVRTALASANGQNQRLEGEVQALRLEIASMREEHIQEMTAMKEQHARCEREQVELRREIDRLMAESKTATYTPQDLRRVAP